MWHDEILLKFVIFNEVRPFSLREGSLQSRNARQSILRDKTEQHQEGDEDLRDINSTKGTCLSFFSLG